MHDLITIAVKQPETCLIVASLQLIVGAAEHLQVVRGVSSGRLARLIGRFEELSGETAARHGGRVVKHIGDAAMVVFADVTAGWLGAADAHNAFACWVEQDQTRQRIRLARIVRR